MSIQTIGTIGGAPPQPATSPGTVPKAVAPRDAAPVEARPQAAPPPEQPSREKVQEVVEDMRKSVSNSESSNLQFTIDDESGGTIVRVTDQKTGELIRQIPSEEMVELAKSLDRMQGKLLRQQV